MQRVVACVATERPGTATEWLASHDGLHRRTVFPASIGSCRSDDGTGVAVAHPGMARGHGGIPAGPETWIRW
jgi:hypothetical protein